MNKPPQGSLRAHLLALLATLIISGSFPASDILAGVISPYSLTLLRFVAAALLLLPVVIMVKRWRKKVLPTMPRALVISFFYVTFFVLMFKSLETTTSLNTAAIYTFVPLLTALFAFLVLKERLSGKVILFYLIGAVGACWVVFNGDFSLLMSFSVNKGDYLFLVAVVFMCFYTIAMKLLYRNDEMIPLVFCTLLGGAFWLMLTLLFLNEPLQWEKIEGSLIYSMAYLAIPATLLTAYLYQKATVMIGPGRVNAYIYLNPALVALIVMFHSGESIANAVIPGIIISTLATIIIQLDSQRKNT